MSTHTSNGPAESTVSNGRLASVPPPLSEIRDELHHPANAKDATIGGSAAVSSSTSSSASPPTAEERCRRARLLASHWMASLMENPPTADAMNAFREQHQHQRQEHGQTRPATDDVVPSSSSPVPTTRPPVHVDSSVTKPASTSPSSSSFAEAVRRGPQLAGGSTPPLPPAAAAPLPATADITPARASAATATTASAKAQKHSEDAQHNTHAAAADAPPSLLMPVDNEALGPLLRSLREVALSSSSLDTMRRLASLPGADGAGSNGSSSSGTGSHNHGTGKRHHGHQNGPRASPRQSPPPSPSTSAGVDPVIEGVFGEQWQTVQLHLFRIEHLVQNHDEFSRALVSQLGPDWRATTPAPQPVSTTTAAAVAAVAVAMPPPPATASVTPLPPPPPPPAPVATVSVATGGAVGSGLNFNARPFQSRTFTISSPTQLSSSPTTSTAAVTAPMDGADDVNTTNNNNNTDGTERSTSAPTSRKASKSLQKLSESATAYYSPSAQVASFIERNSPVPMGNGSVASGRTLSLGSLRTTPVASAAASDHDLDGSNVDEDELPSVEEVLPSPASSTPSHTISDGLQVPVTPNAIGTLVNARFPSYPRPTRASVLQAGGGGGGGDGAGGVGGFTTSAASGVGHYHNPHSPMGVSSSVASPTGAMSQPHHSGSSSSLAFHLESREDMLRRRQAAPTAFYSSASHPNATTTSPASYSGSGAVYSPGSLRPHHVGNTPMSMPVSPLVSMGNTPVMAPQCPYDYILVLDFEATCEEYPPPGYLYEIIEFPVVLVDVRLQRAMTEFHRFVKPKYKPVLSPFCRNLTGILQQEIDAAQPLDEVLRQFERWLHQTVPPSARVMFATDGPMDFREFMLHHSVQRQGIRFPTVFYQFIDVKQVFASFLQCQPGKIKAMLEVLNIPFEGRLHSGLDDARNIARIVIGLLQWGSTLCESPLNRLPLSGGPNGPNGSATSSSGGGTGALYLPPSTADTPNTLQTQHQQHQRGTLAFNSSGSWLASARDTSYSIDGTFYA